LLLQVLLYVLDGSAFDSTRTPAEDLKALLNELELYSKKLVKKPSLVFINKTDVKGTTIARDVGM
jgi:GTPase involved in cell partitioning and DNA repair